ncbi:hypothetical protein [Desulfallas thermosapovorans]|uniref:Uncharacterized protein n=1 Tax=Desulfallas thermosapovorans DSM 6562 TaxID=1121431 RepID=A0A5S4ZSN4_9FIRM|nr:hypothetical protein [Desulfallas thermosapovorans]TYO95949.1 hypothetical protein LX24_01339 [Desulfallas thermosapovorans DSM 6562]
MITNKKTFTLGIVLMFSFMAVFAFIMSPSFGNGRNGLEYADDMFNSLSKGSAYFIEEEMGKADQMTGHEINVTIAAADNTQAQTWEKLYTAAGADISVSGTELTLSGDLGGILKAAIADSDAMYNNQGDRIAGSYGVEAKVAVYGWHTSFKAISAALEKQQSFAESAAIQSVMQKALEPSYNYYGIEPKKVADYAAVVILLLVFYVVYTMWYGFAIYFLADGFGITATKSAQKVQA